MSLARRKTIGWLLLTATVLIFLPISMPGASTAGRDFARCIHACNAARQSCSDQCPIDCASLFPGNAHQQKACTMTCRNACVAAEQECKTVCRAIKDGTSPNNPT